MVDIDTVRKIGLSALRDNGSDYATGFAAGIDWLYTTLTGRTPTGGFKEPCKKK